jgi:hypothetical protein
MLKVIVRERSKMKTLSNTSLQEVKKEILTYVNAKGLGIFHGITENFETTSILWDHTKGDWKDFIDIAEHEGIKFLIYEEIVFSQQDLDDLLQSLTDNRALGLESESQSLKELHSKVSAYGQFCGGLALFRIGWMKEGIGYFYQRSCRWFEEFIEFSREADSLIEPIKQREKKSKKIGNT